MIKTSIYVPPLMYAFRLTGDVIKIGWTSDLNNRRRQLGAQWVDLLAIKEGTIEQERALHRSIPSVHRYHSIEYYKPTPYIIALLNEWRADMGQPPLDVQQAAA